jgi:hypothetical protein
MTESIYTTQQPIVIQPADGISRQLGLVFTTNTNGVITGGRYWVPPAGLTAVVVWQLWRVGDQALLASQDLHLIGPVSPNGFCTFLLPSPIPIVTTQTYKVVTYNDGQGQWVVTDDGTDTFPIVRPHLTASTGTFRNGGLVGDFPSNNFDAYFFSDVIFEESGGSQSGTVDFSLNLSLSAAGSESGRRLDPVVELYEAALACLCAAVAENPNPPAHCAPRVGPEIAYDMGQYTDYCCEGLAYISLGDTWASSASFPEQDIVRQANAVCPPVTWAQDFKLGIIRCSPTGNENGEPPTDADWLAAAAQNLVDAQSLRVAACCFRNFVIANTGLYTGMSVVINRQTQVTPNGGCVERYVTITVQFPNLDCSC